MCITFNVDGNALVIEMDMNSNDKSVINFCIAYISITITILLLHYYYMNCKYFLVVTFMYFNKLVPAVVVFLIWGVGTDEVYFHRHKDEFINRKAIIY